ncbi:MAG: heme exporter protein CcmD [Lautropia sp.]|nr:heme exporter protein CcmD [Lautropia sp.]
MNHWQMIAIAYGLTFGALALEVVLLCSRRRAALQQARAWLDADVSSIPARPGSGAPS